LSVIRSHFRAQILEHFRFRSLRNGLPLPATGIGGPRAYLNFGRVITMDRTSFVVAEMGCDDREYDSWLTTLTEAFARLDVLQTAVTKLCSLCENEDVNSGQVLEVLGRYGAISPYPRGRSCAVRPRKADVVHQLGASRP
jgi:hypothetical protein